MHGISFDDRDVENATEIKMQVLDRRGLMADFCKACVAKGISVIRGTLYDGRGTRWRIVSYSSTRRHTAR